MSERRSGLSMRDQIAVHGTCMWVLGAFFSAIIVLPAMEGAAPWYWYVLGYAIALFAARPWYFRGDTS